MEETAGQQLTIEQEAYELRTELDELLRASRYAGQRERRLNEAIRSTPGRNRPDGDLLRQLAQARTLREGLGARCLQLSNQIQELEIQLRHDQQLHPGQQPQQPPSQPQPQPELQQPHQPPQPQPQPQPQEQPLEEPPPVKPDLGALTQRITTLHRSGADAEATELLNQAAVLLTPADAALLIGMLARRGPTGASLQLAATCAGSAPEQAVAVLVELRELGLAEEAEQLFRAFWAYPATDLPALLAALERAGQHADGATLLWEWGSAPTPELTSLAAALRQHGRQADVRTLLRQAAGRPTPDLAVLATDLLPELSTILLQELAALRPPTEVARLAASISEHPSLYGQLLAALLANEARHRTTLAALRSAGLPTTPRAPRSRWAWR
ncbi:hypothetical protein [Streptomyces sp. NRRL WC-3742]|uniref:hypothetical protein n=1 Tax=Streptomyces sp. NRRL WC-3742 TaxID=1463934 RepID=UPI0004C6372D|nr:hypothetical protein [Streptomyces sp. NRRL WC-3742]